MQSTFTDLIYKVSMIGLCAFLFIYLICITIDLVKFLRREYSGKKQLPFENDNDDDSDLGIFMQ